MNENDKIGNHLDSSSNEPFKNMGNLVDLGHFRSVKIARAALGKGGRDDLRIKKKNQATSLLNLLELVTRVVSNLK